jgi:signal transduction histidine kinase
MPINQKTAMALLLMLVALLVGAAVILSQAVQPGFVRLERAAHERDLARVSANLAALGADLQSRTNDYAHWDDTFEFLGGRNASYTEDLTDDWFSDYTIDIAVFADDRGRILYARRREASGAVVEDAETGAALVADARAITHGEEPAVGVVRLPDGGFIMVSAAPATRSDGSGTPRGMVLLGVRISPEALQNQTQLDTELIGAADAPSDVAGRFAALDEASPQSWVDAGQLNGLFALRDLRGRIVGAVRTVRAREIAALGQHVTTVALILFAFMAALVVAALWLLLRRALIARIQRLEKHFNAQWAEPRPLPLDPGERDEISRLTAAYNALAMRLKETAARERAAQVQRETEAAANRMKSAFLANVSHELRTPLNAVIGYTELIEEDLHDCGVREVDADLERINDAARQLLRLVNEILDLSKIEVGRLEVRPESFRVDEMMQGAAGSLASVAEENGVTLDVQTDGDLGLAYSDQNRLRQGLVNVLTYACSVSTVDSVVTLRAARVKDGDGEILRFEIQDSSEGLTEEQLQRAFEPFNSDALAAEGFAGSSLALAVTRKLVTLLGGSLDASSTPGKGTQFVLRIPALMEDNLAVTQVRAA